MLSSIRRALTPNQSQVEDNNNNNNNNDTNDTSALTLDTSSPQAPNPLIHPYPSSPPPFSPIQVSPEDFPPWTNHQTLKPNHPVTAGQQLLSMDISPHRLSPHPEHQGTGHSLFSSMSVNDVTSKPHYRGFTLDGVSDNHLQPPLEGAYASGSPLPSVEPTQSTSDSHRTQRTPTPGKNHPSLNSRVSSPQKTFNPQTETPHLPHSPLPSTAPVQSPSEAQPTQQFPTQNGVYPGLEPGLSGISEPSKMATKKTRQTALHPTVAEGHPILSGVPDVEPQQNAPANADDAETTTTSNAQPPKRKLEEDPANSESKPVKKQRNQPKKEEASATTVKSRGIVEAKLPKERSRTKKGESSTANIEQQDATEDEVPKKRGTQKKEQGPTESDKQKDTPKDEMPKKRGRPKKEEGSTLSVKSKRVSEEGTPAKRGRPKKEIAPQNTTTEDPIEQDTVATEIPKKRGRPAREAKPAQDAEPVSVSTVDTPKKRGRPKKTAEPDPIAESQVASTANTSRKKRRAKKNEVIAEASEPQGPPKVETSKKRGPSKATGQDKITKKSTAGKRGRPKKN